MVKTINGIYCAILLVVIVIVTMLSILGNGFRSVQDEKRFAEGVWKRYEWINLSGVFSRVLNVRSMYKSDNVNIGTNGYIFGSYAQTSTDYEFEEIVSFKKYLDSKNIGFLYVNEPLKYTDDADTLRDFGILSYGNSNADKLLNRIGKEGINTIDLRDFMRNENISSWELFYRTDHHWTVPAGLWATKHIAENLNMQLGMNINTQMYQDDNYRMVKYKLAWLGEQGRRVAASYVGYDDYTLIEPAFPTSFTFFDGKKEISGDFSIFLDKSRLDVEADPYKVGSWHYAYFPLGINGISIVNNNVQKGKVLYLGESYDHVVVPFLALGVHRIDVYVLRETDKSVRDIVEAGDYDVVIMGYAQLDIGAHDNVNNANYRMYDLE